MQPGSQGLGHLLWPLTTSLPPSSPYLANDNEVQDPLRAVLPCSLPCPALYADFRPLLAIWERPGQTVKFKAWAALSALLSASSLA